MDMRIPVLFVLLAGLSVLAAQDSTVKLSVDATDAPRRLFHVRISMTDRECGGIEDQRRRADHSVDTLSDHTGALDWSIFNADYLPSYREADAKDAWKRMLDWFKKYDAA